MNDWSPDLDMGEEQEDDDQSFEYKVFFFFFFSLNIFSPCLIVIKSRSLLVGILVETNMFIEVRTARVYFYPCKRTLRNFNLK